MAHLLHVRDLSSLSQTCRLLYRLDTQGRWAELWAEAFGSPNSVVVRATRLAGGWRQLYKERIVTQRAMSPWFAPSPSEVGSFLHLLVEPPAPTERLNLLFFLDSSGADLSVDTLTGPTRQAERAQRSRRCAWWSPRGYYLILQGAITAWQAPRRKTTSRRASNSCCTRCRLCALARSPPRCAAALLLLLSTTSLMLIEGNNNDHPPPFPEHLPQLCYVRPGWHMAI